MQKCCNLLQMKHRTKARGAGGVGNMLKCAYLIKQSDFTNSQLNTE